MGSVDIYSFPDPSIFQKENGEREEKKKEKGKRAALVHPFDNDQKILNSSWLNVAC